MKRRFQRSAKDFKNRPKKFKNGQNTVFLDLKFVFLDQIDEILEKSFNFRNAKTAAVILITISGHDFGYFGYLRKTNGHFWPKSGCHQAKIIIFVIYASGGCIFSVSGASRRRFGGNFHTRPKMPAYFFRGLRIFLKALLGLIFHSKTLSISEFRMYSLICGCMTSMF